MALSFSHLWQQQEHSDVDIVLKTVVSSNHQLATLPGHTVLLSNSQVFQAQVLRLQDMQQQPPAKTRRTTAKNSTPSTNVDRRPQLVLELQDSSEQVAALAVLSSLYLTKPLPELLSELTQEQQLQAALLADKWQVPNVSTAATRLLVGALNAESGLSESVQQQVMGAAALPDCLQPLLRRVLLSVLGDLEAAWADAGLQEQLLGLSAPAMELLLSCDELKVAAEDTVLYTVQRYLDKLSNSPQQQDVQQRLAPLVRCQHLSQCWLSISAVSEDAKSMALGSLRPQLSRLLMLRCAKAALTSQPKDLLELVPDAPASWALGRRQTKAVSSVSMTWNLPVNKLQDAARRCTAERDCIAIDSPDRTAPLGGIAFMLSAECTPHDAGCEVGLFAYAANLPEDGYYSFYYQIESAGTVEKNRSPVLPTDIGFGLQDFFSLGGMAGGWDEAAWAAKGLPASGLLQVQLTVTKVGHNEVPAPAAAQPPRRRLR